MKEKFKKVQFEVECIGMSNDGKGICYHENIPGFVDGLLLNEKALVETTYRTKQVFYAKIIKLINKSDKRVNPICPVSSSCGGCQLLHLDYQEQLKFKQNRVKECLKKIGDIEIDVNEVIGMDIPYFYRNKIQMPLKLVKGQICSGFYKEKSHDIVPIEICYIENKDADHILLTIKKLMKKYRILPYDEDKRTGVIRHILIRNSLMNQNNMVVIVSNVDSFPGRNDFIKELTKLEPSISTIVQNTNKRDTNVILGEKEKILFGKGYIEDKLCNVLFKISAKSFFQVNPVQTEKLYKLAIEKANISKNDTVLDAYCGIGTIGLIASTKAKQVIGVEIEKSAVIDALNNAKNNNIKNALFYCDDAGEFILKQYQEGKIFDIVIMDPPRKGSDEKFLSILLKTKPKKIIYISCDPATLARDLKILKKTYQINSVTPVDMFPNTIHVETVVCLSKQK